MRRNNFQETITKATLLLLGLVALGQTLLTSCASKAEDSPLKIAYLPITHTLPLFALNELAASSRQSQEVELVKFGSWNELSDALNTGSVDGAVLLTEIAIKARENGVPLKAVALGHHDGNVIVVAPEIDDPKQLRGKTVAIPHRLSSHNILLQMVLQRGGLTADDVKVTELPPPEMPAALSEKRIAAYIVAEPFGAKAVVQGIGKVLYSSPELWPRSICCTLVLREDAIDGRHEEAAALLHDYRLAADSLVRSPQFALATAEKYLSAPEPVLKKSLEWIDFSDLRLRQDEYQLLTHWTDTLGLTKKAPSFTEFTDTTLLNAKP